MWGKRVWCGLACCLFGLSAGPVLAEPQRHALVVGVREFPASEKLPPLAFTEPDAEKIAATLAAAEFRVILMTQAAARPQGQQRLNPTATFIRSQFAGLVNTPFLKAEDCLLVVLEGHGIQLPSKTNADQQTFYFCPADAQIDGLQFAEDVQPQHNLIPVQELYDTLKKSPAGVKLLVVDACRNDPNKPSAFRSSNSVTRPPVPVPPGGIAALFSCSAEQRAAEDPELGHGVFSHFLIEALTGKADLDSDGQINIPELHQYVGNRTYAYVQEKYNARQLPEFKGEIRGWAPLLAVPSMKPLAEGRQAGELWDGNSLRMKLCWCPPGSYNRGSPTSEKDRRIHETLTPVKLSRGFWLGQHEITQSQWQKVMGTTVADQAAKTTSVKTLAGTGDAHPVYFVNWDDALEFCRKLTEQERAANRLPAGWEYTLPTDAQWEYACRAGSTAATAFGNSLSSLQANFHGNYPYNGAVQGEFKSETVPVGSYRPNAWNLHDMHGNVLEWCRDWYLDKPPGGTDPEVQTPGTDHVLRGGSWVGRGEECRSASRLKGTPSQRINRIGFRVALVSLSPSKPAPETPLVTPTPMAMPQPSLEKFVGTKAGDLWEQNSLKMKFRWCPPGQFSMGSPANEKDRVDDENQVTVTLTSGFWLGQYEVTQTEWRQVMATTPWKGDFQDDVPLRPATRVQWKDAVEFCRMLTDREQRAGRLPSGWAYTLPTEAQWEYACRAGTTTRFSFGDDPDDSTLSQYAWFDRNSLNIGKRFAHPVGQKKANPWQFHDLHGNVWEWCRDWYGAKLPGGTDPVVLEQASHLVLRGGGWGSFDWSCRSAVRFKYTPESSGFDLGFRVAVVPVAPGKPVTEAPVVIPMPQPGDKLTAGTKAGDLWEKNSLASKFRWCPPGKFQMGPSPLDLVAFRADTTNSQVRQSRGSSQVAVTLKKGYWLGQHEVTQAEWTQIMGTTPWRGQVAVLESEKCAASWVTWENANSFCAKLTALGHSEGWLPADWKVDLPTEAQWEYACRAGTTTAYHFGGDEKQLVQYAWTISNSISAGESYAHEVGQKQPNAWNLYDMHGNVEEWCRDCYQDKLPGGTDPEVRNQTEARVTRGGGFNKRFSWGYRIAYRQRSTTDYSYASFGFRVALVPAAP